MGHHQLKKLLLLVLTLALAPKILPVLLLLLLVRSSCDVIFVGVSGCSTVSAAAAASDSAAALVAMLSIEALPSDAFAAIKTGALAEV